MKPLNCNCRAAGPGGVCFGKNCGSNSLDSNLLIQVLKNKLQKTGVEVWVEEGRLFSRGYASGREVK